MRRPVTPDEARVLLDGTTPGPWEVDHDHAWEPGVWSPDSIIFGPYYDRQDMEQWEAGSGADLRLAAAAPALAAMIARMTPEYRAEYYEAALDKWVLVTGWTTEYDARYALRPGIFRAAETRIRIRYVTEPEEA